MTDDVFRAGMRRLSGAVSIVTTLGAKGERRGITVTSVCSLSVDPPALVTCINRETWVGQAAPESCIFCVNVLARDQQSVAETFAGRTGLRAEDRFQVGAWIDRASGAPRLAGAIASFDCRLDRIVEFTTHVILIGAVTETTIGPGDALPLVYVDGDFTTTANAARFGQAATQSG